MAGPKKQRVQPIGVPRILCGNISARKSGGWKSPIQIKGKAPVGGLGDARS